MDEMTGYMKQIVGNSECNHPTKAHLRNALLAARHAIDPALRTQWDAAICRHVANWCLQHPAPVLGVYWPMRGEPDLRGVFDVLMLRGVRLALPVVAADTPLRFVEWVPGGKLIRDNFGVMVPTDLSRAVEPDALLIPCVGFSAERFRLGYGGGFYDRTLGVVPRPVAVGVAYSCLKAEFEIGSHDVAMDGVITEGGEC